MASAAASSAKKSRLAVASMLLAMGRVEAEICGDLVAIDVERGARDGACAERQLVHAAPRVVEPTAVAPQHLEPGQQVMREAHRLSALQMRIAGQERR